MGHGSWRAPADAWQGSTREQRLKWVPLGVDGTGYARRLGLLAGVIVQAGTRASFALGYLA